MIALILLLQIQVFPKVQHSILKTKLPVENFQKSNFDQIFDNSNYILDPLTVEVAKAMKETEIIIKFNRPVILKDSNFTIANISIKNSSLLSDQRTVKLFTTPMKNKEIYNLLIECVKDNYDNEITTTVSFQYFSHNIISYYRGEFIESSRTFSEEPITTDSFTIRMKVRKFNGVKNSILFQSEDDTISIKITDNNHITFKVHSMTVTSQTELNESIHFVTFVRESNSYLKIYFERELNAAEWDKNMETTITLHNLILNKNDVVYNYVKIFNYGLKMTEISAEEISIKNQFIERVFSISNDHVRTIEINNFRTDELTTIFPEEGSEEFFFSIPEKIENNEKMPIPIDRTNWTVSSNSEESVTLGAKEGPAENLIDGNIGTIWHSKYNNKEGGHDDRADKKDPFQVTFDFGKDIFFKSFSYTPRQEGVNGRINHYEVYVARTIEELNESILLHKYDVKGDFSYPTLAPIFVNFSCQQFARFVALLSVDHDGYGSGADFNLYDHYAPVQSVEIRSSEIELDRYEISQTEHGQFLTFYYKPFLFKFVQFNITVEYELQNEKHYIEKGIKIRIPQEKVNDIQIEYLDLDRIVISNDDKEKSWSHPFVDSTRSDLLSKYIITLGQPVYISSFFTGCRFSFSDSQIVDNLVFHRYQSGKKFSQLKLEENSTYRCWKTVIGTSRSQGIEVIRSDFFSYITDISVENKFRKQYNSWYDWMLTITESNILTSFKEIEKGCTQHGVKPLDSYVIDDGWNNYNYWSLLYFVYDISRSGTSFNNVGFWAINNKFPDNFDKPSKFAQSVSSNFGVWLGPRGGYNFNYQFAHMIESYGFGYYNSESGDVDVASTKYTNKLKDFLIDWIKQYKVNYFKLDGWLLKPCKNKDHDHVVGGYDGVYQYTDYWERYIEVFEEMRKTADEHDVKNLWISLTCYINPSPFHLQWANSIWLQISGDIGYTKLTKDDTYADQMLNYRDNVYYEFYNIYQFQLPQQSIYNHDPIYGKTNTPLAKSLDDEEFRKFLLMCGMRGTSFFELYYTYSMIDEGDKWYVNSEVLNYIEKRHHVLKNSQIFGGRPAEGDVYGYSAWSENCGTIAIRNPSDEVKEYTIKLNREIGVPEKVPTTYRKIVFSINTIEDLNEGKPQNYNDEIKVTLQPREVRIIDFEPTPDTECAEVEVIRAIDQKEIQIRFNKKIKFDVANYEFNNDIKIESGKRRGDLRTVSLYLQQNLVNNTEYVITLKNVSDSIGNVLNTNLNYIYMSENLIVSIQNEIGPFESDSCLSSTEFKVDSFTVHLNIKKRNDENEILLNDAENEVTIEIIDRKVKFTVKSVSVESKEEIHGDESVKITCVRERNTMIKIYINGELSNSNFNENQREVTFLRKIQICRSSAVYGSLFVASYGYSYNEVMSLNDEKE